MLNPIAKRNQRLLSQGKYPIHRSATGCPRSLNARLFHTASLLQRDVSWQGGTLGVGVCERNCIDPATGLVC